MVSGKANGRSAVELLFEMVLILVLAPVIVCCFLQGITWVVGIVIPWLAIVMIVVGIAACFAAVLAANRSGPGIAAPPPDRGLPLLPPVRRPSGARERPPRERTNQ